VVVLGWEEVECDKLGILVSFWLEIKFQCRMLSVLSSGFNLYFLKASIYRKHKLGTLIYIRD
jgi:hypothetical protein